MIRLRVRVFRVMVRARVFSLRVFRARVSFFRVRG